MSAVWSFIQYQVLGMRWLDDLIGGLLTTLNVDIGTRLGGSAQFFLYDLIKIVILLVTLIFIISYIQTYYPPERTKQILSKIDGIKGNTVGALLGTVTPFCSCSSIPIFIGFTKAGLPLGVTFSFLISSPLVDFAALTILMSIFGVEVAVLYVIVGVIIAVIGGLIIEHMHMEDQIADFARPDYLPAGGACPAGNCACSKPAAGLKQWNELTPRNRADEAWMQVKTTLRKVFPYAVLGVFIGALIHNWIPTDIIQAVLGENNPLSVPIASLIGVPVYADIFGTMPIAEALYGKGIEIGTILAFMMSVTITSIPSLVMLRTVVKRKLLVMFVGICILGVILTGYLFNFIF
ncbi:MAG: permease [Candidatus Methanomethylophilus sp.]|nr:permease [Methanomethylophilus sp.]